MNRQSYKHFLYALSALILVSIGALWAWNTLAELTELPSAQYRHVLAGLFFLFLIKWVATLKHKGKRAASGQADDVALD